MSAKTFFLLSVTAVAIGTLIALAVAGLYAKREYDTAAKESVLGKIGLL